MSFFSFGKVCLRDITKTSQIQCYGRFLKVKNYSLIEGYYLST